MQILVVAATGMEIAPFMANNPADDILIAGVGSPATIYHLLKRLQQVDYDMVIQAGIAGSFNAQIPSASSVLVYRDVFADLGIEENGAYYTLGEKGLIDTDAFPYTNGWLVNDNPLLEQIDLPKVTSITVNKISDSKAQEEQFVQKFVSDIESMEGAALHYICLQEQVPFLQLRSISNTIGERDKTKWNMNPAIENLNMNLESVIHFLKQNF
ncbi:MAG: futalosine hydrolase [Ferruginibacter sp.]